MQFDRSFSWISQELIVVLSFQIEKMLCNESGKTKWKKCKSLVIKNKYFTSHYIKFNYALRLKLYPRIAIWNVSFENESTVIILYIAKSFIWIGFQEVVRFFLLHVSSFMLVFLLHSDQWHKSAYNKDRHTMKVLIKTKKNLWAILLIVPEHFKTFSTADPSSPVNTILICY